MFPSGYQANVSLLAALMALPLAMLVARTLRAPRLLARVAKGALDVSRAVHTLVFGLILVGIVIWIGMRSRNDDQGRYAGLRVLR